MRLYPVKTTADRHSLLLFFAGWGMDERPFLEYLPDDRDCIVCYDYRSLAFDESLLTPYRNIRVVAWSMGVWAAAQALGGRQWPVAESIAVNGTPSPVDDERGIAAAVFRATLEGFGEVALQKFRRRMCGSKEALLHFMERAPLRTVEDLREELAQIGRLASECPPAAFRWDMAYIGMRDKIFLPAGQLRCWEGGNLRMIDCEHYPTAAFWREFFYGASVAADKTGSAVAAARPDVIPDRHE
jgi:malonyl-CoA O-methyltransferase/biotin synthesis protein BioG